jgi:hypothetical protein
MLGVWAVALVVLVMSAVGRLLRRVLRLLLVVARIVSLVAWRRRTLVVVVPTTVIVVARHGLVLGRKIRRGVRGAPL